MINTIKTCLLLACFTMFSLTSYGAAVDEYCNKVKEEKSDTQYKELHQEAIEVATKLCYNMKRGFTNEKYSVNHLRLNTNEEDLMRNIEQLINQKFPMSMFTSASKFAKSWVMPTNVTPILHKSFPTFSVDSATKQVNGVQVNTYTLIGRNQRSALVYKDNNLAQKNHCITVNGAPCEDILREIEKTLKPYNYYIKDYVNTSVDTAINTSLLQWDMYNKEAPVIGLYSRLATTFYHRNHFYNIDNPWPGPPPVQIRALEISLVLDHLPTAADGNETKPGAALEWLGFNDWDNKTIPWGAGITSVYVDRNGAKSLGHGLMIHLKNEYSFGVTRRGSENTFFFNINLAEWFGENKAKLSDFKKKKKPDWLDW
jgi:hypothetical protein